ncbi:MULTISPECIES: helix-turn-helix transcriptional regulator [unclassified Beijerinckia]|uniref:AraC family transcriptional regulator n=1 Tax=unclassified Beijerinckia TaxID=2638183 RepID=UPI000894C929|nr:MULTISPECIES: helix-turn-helix transcriptional regulator [unclassified Beijerinckia]MDH7794605.1 AraC-like DNA-binding protein [Beijerinckia sp. GAS462]SEB68248.1 transcriptional regulator, AraC family [Beijerinckia sp. 28-YEA-48]
MPSRFAHTDFELDGTDRPAVALHLDFKDYATEVPTHRHRKGQLVLALHGAVTCHVADGWWMVPPQCGVWIPGGMAHSNRATANARLSYLFVEPEAVALPRQCCTLSISPMIREMISHLARQPPDYEPGSHTDRLVGVLLDELMLMPREDFHLPVSSHPKIRRIAEALDVDPGDRSTLTQWAARVAVSERSLARLMVQETGLTFGRWRQQFHLMLALREIAAGASVQSVSEMLGYESVTAFITMFKKALGQTPARYLAERRGD